MELKHLRKGKINKISTEDLQRELDKLLERERKRQKEIDDNETYRDVLAERIANDPNNGYKPNVKKDYPLFHQLNPDNWTEDRAEWERLNDIVINAYHSIEKMQKKKQILENELVDRLLTE